MFPKMERFGISRNFTGKMKRENLVSNESIRVKLSPRKDHDADVSRVSPFVVTCRLDYEVDL